MSEEIAEVEVETIEAPTFKENEQPDLFPNAPTTSFDKIVEEAAGAEKEDYKDQLNIQIDDGNSKPPKDPPPPTVSGTDGEQENSAPQQPDSNVVDYLVLTLDQVLAFLLAMWCGEDDSDVFKAKTSQKKDLIEQIKRGAAENNVEIKFPWWMGLSMVAVATYGGSFMKAKKLRKMKGMGKPKAPPQTAKQYQQAPATGAPVQAVVVEEDSTDNGGYPFGPNPITPEQNQERLKAGGVMCGACGVNYTKNADKKYCGQICSGKGTRKAK